ncbi:YfhD family protein [Paenibacillus septentrionalis]|uniref:YfhD family protein n=1 Tax=Paenibacillus septentrionalis TaxID=429342 RepID=A0ABW1V9D3_9BACL
MGRNNNQGHSKNKSSLPQTPKNEKIAPNEVQEEFAQEIADLTRRAPKKTTKK